MLKPKIEFGDFERTNLFTLLRLLDVGKYPDKETLLVTLVNNPLRFDHTNKRVFKRLGAGAFVISVPVNTPGADTVVLGNAGSVILTYLCPNGCKDQVEAIIKAVTKVIIDPITYNLTKTSVSKIVQADVFDSQIKEVGNVSTYIGEAYSLYNIVLHINKKSKKDAYLLRMKPVNALDLDFLSLIKQLDEELHIASL